MKIIEIEGHTYNVPNVFSGSSTKGILNTQYIAELMIWQNGIHFRKWLGSSIGYSDEYIILDKETFMKEFDNNFDDSNSDAYSEGYLCYAMKNSIEKVDREIIWNVYKKINNFEEVN